MAGLGYFLIRAIHFNVCTGTASPDDKFVVYNGSTTGRYTTSGWTHTSDIRLKKNIRPLEGSLEKILQLNGIRFDFKTENKDNSSHIGFIAQDVEKVFPEVVQTGSDGYKSIAYGYLEPALVEAIKEQQSQLQKQQKQLQKDKEDIEYLKQELIGSTALLLEATNSLKVQTKEIQDLKAEIVSLEGKVVGKQ